MPKMLEISEGLWINTHWISQVLLIHGSTAKQGVVEKERKLEITSHDGSTVTARGLWVGSVMSAMGLVSRVENLRG